MKEHKVCMVFDKLFHFLIALTGHKCTGKCNNVFHQYTLTNCIVAQNR